VALISTGVSSAEQGAKARTVTSEIAFGLWAKPRLGRETRQLIPLSRLPFLEAVNGLPRFRIGRSWCMAATRFFIELCIFILIKGKGDKLKRFYKAEILPKKQKGKEKQHKKQNKIKGLDV
jgi:hypothetical protein